MWSINSHSSVLYVCSCCFKFAAIFSLKAWPPQVVGDKLWVKQLELTYSPFTSGLFWGEHMTQFSPVRVSEVFWGDYWGIFFLSAKQWSKINHGLSLSSFCGCCHVRMWYPEMRQTCCDLIGHTSDAQRPRQRWCKKKSWVHININELLHTLELTLGDSWNVGKWLLYCLGTFHWAFVKSNFILIDTPLAFISKGSSIHILVDIKEESKIKPGSGLKDKGVWLVFTLLLYTFFC